MKACVDHILDEQLASALLVTASCATRTKHMVVTRFLRRNSELLFLGWEGGEILNKACLPQINFATAHLHDKSLLGMSDAGAPYITKAADWKLKNLRKKDPPHIHASLCYDLA